MLNPQFHDTATKFIKALINQRIYLLGTNRSLKNHGHMFQALQNLERYMTSYTYDTDVSMSRFWITHSDDILEIMPGKGSVLYEKNFEVYKNLTIAAYHFLNHPAPLREPLTKSSLN